MSVNRHFEPEATVKRLSGRGNRNCSGTPTRLSGPIRLSPPFLHVPSSSGFLLVRCCLLFLLFSTFCDYTFRVLRVHGFFVVVGVDIGDMFFVARAHLEGRLPPQSGWQGRWHMFPHPLFPNMRLFLQRNFATLFWPTLFGRICFVVLLCGRCLRLDRRSLRFPCLCNVVHFLLSVF